MHASYDNSYSSELSNYSDIIDITSNEYNLGSYELRGINLYWNNSYASVDRYYESDVDGNKTLPSWTEDQLLELSKFGISNPEILSFKVTGDPENTQNTPYISDISLSNNKISRDNNTLYLRKH